MVRALAVFAHSPRGYASLSPFTLLKENEPSIFHIAMTLIPHSTRLVLRGLPLVSNRKIRHYQRHPRIDSPCLLSQNTTSRRLCYPGATPPPSSPFLSHRKIQSILHHCPAPAIICHRHRAHSEAHLTFIPAEDRATQFIHTGSAGSVVDKPVSILYHHLAARLSKIIRQRHRHPKLHGWSCQVGARSGDWRTYVRD